MYAACWLVVCVIINTAVCQHTPRIEQGKLRLSVALVCVCICKEGVAPRKQATRDDSNDDIARVTQVSEWAGLEVEGRTSIARLLFAATTTKNTYAYPLPTLSLKI